MNNEIVIFCQAPADIAYVLTLYEKYKNEKRISIFVINVENIFKFIKSLNLNLHALVFIPYVLKSFKNPFEIIREKKRILNLEKLYFNSIRNADIYFFSRFEDWLTSAFLKILSKKNSIYYLDHYDFSSELYIKQKSSFKLSVLKVIYYLITNVNFKVEIEEKLPEFKYENYNIQRHVPEINKEVFTIYKYEIDIKDTSKSIVLFFISPCENTVYDCQSHDEAQIKIIKSFQKDNWTVVVKGHPRAGIPENVLDIVDFQIPSYIPAEFLQLKDVKMCVGIITAAIAYFAKSNRIKTYSLINLIKFQNITLINYYKNYLLELSDSNVLFFENYNDFETIIKNHDPIK